MFPEKLLVQQGNWVAYPVFSCGIWQACGREAGASRAEDLGRAGAVYGTRTTQHI